MSTKPPSVLFVEPNAELRLVVTEVLRGEGYAVSSATSPDEAASLIRQGARPDVIALGSVASMPASWGLDDLPGVSSLTVVTMARDRSSALPPYSVGAPDASADVVRRAVSDALKATRLEHTERLASIGRLSAGIVHEVRTPLTTVVSAVSLVRAQIQSMLELTVDPVMRARLGNIASTLGVVSEGSDHIARLVSDVQSFAHPGHALRKAVDLGTVVRSAIRLAGGSPQGIRLEVEGGAVSPVLGSAPALTQVVVNLLVNAMDARVGGRDHLVSVRILSDRAESVVEVRDTGAGMSRQTTERLFEPFFTTKAVGAGTGLGLALCRSIVLAHGGRLEVESVLGEGSVFRVALPAMAGDVAEVSSRPVVVLVDHDPAVERLVRRVVAQRATLRVVESDAAAWLDADVVLCDVDVHGLALYRKVLACDPAMASKFVLLSSRGEQELLETGRVILRKPFSPADLLAVLAPSLG